MDARRTLIRIAGMAAIGFVAFQIWQTMEDRGILVGLTHLAAFLVFTAALYWAAQRANRQ